jgi:NADP-dependent 3-hydroxy acid dehydrogenase YdfG
MRVLKDFSLAGCKVTLFHWNSRYLIKLEQGRFEQTFKIDQFDISDEKEIEKFLDETFMEQAERRFSDMAQSLRDAMQRA